MLPLFKKTKELEQQVEEYLELLSKSSLIFKEGVNDYLGSKWENFESHLQNLREAEKGADHLRRNIETQVYVHTLIPEARGDVLALLETTDNVTDQAKDTLMDFSIQRPDIPEEFRQDFGDLTNYVVHAVDSMVCATRAFFRDVNTVKDHLHKVHFYEKEADRVSERLKRKIFKSDAPGDLAHKTHLRFFTMHIDRIADYAEDVADRLAIYTIKRTV